MPNYAFFRHDHSTNAVVCHFNHSCTSLNWKFVSATNCTPLSFYYPQEIVRVPVWRRLLAVMESVTYFNLVSITPLAAVGGHGKTLVKQKQHRTMLDFMLAIQLVFLPCQLSLSARSPLFLPEPPRKILAGMTLLSVLTAQSSNVAS